MLAHITNDVYFNNVIFCCVDIGVFCVCVSWWCLTLCPGYPQSFMNLWVDNAVTRWCLCLGCLQSCMALCVNIGTGISWWHHRLTNMELIMHGQMFVTIPTPHSAISNIRGDVWGRLSVDVLIVLYQISMTTTNLGTYFTHKGLDVFFDDMTDEPDFVHQF